MVKCCCCENDAERRGLHRVVRKKFVPDDDGILAVAVTIGAGMIGDHEKTSARLNEV